MPVQTTYSQNPRSRVAGMVADSFGPPQFEGQYALSTRQLVNIVNTGQDGTYTITIDGVEVANFVASGNTATQVRDDLVSDLDAAGIVNQAVSTDQLLIEAPGDDADDGFTIEISTVSGYALTTLVAHHQEVPFGLGLVADVGGIATPGKKCRLPRLATDVSSGLFLGIAARNSMREPNANGWKNHELPDILRVGRIYVTAEGSGSKGDNLSVRHAAGGAGSQLGAFGVGTDSNTRVAVPGLRALEDWSTGGPVLAELYPQT